MSTPTPLCCPSVGFATDAMFWGLHAKHCNELLSLTQGSCQTDGAVRPE